jgi:hypothetical protein
LRSLKIFLIFAIALSPYFLYSILNSYFLICVVLAMCLRISENK